MKFPLIAFLLPSLTSGFSTAGVLSNVVPPSSKARASSSPPLCMSKDSPSSEYDLPIFDLPLEFTLEGKLVIQLARDAYAGGGMSRRHGRRRSAVPLRIDTNGVENERSAVRSRYNSSCLSLWIYVTTTTTTTTIFTVSNLVYAFASLRRLVRDHEETFNPNLNDRQRKKKKIVAFDTPALVDTRFSADKKFPSTKLNNPVTAVAIKEFLDKNKKFFKLKRDNPNFKFLQAGTNEDPLWLAESIENLGTSFDADIVEFDDKFAYTDVLKTELVYAVIVNR